MQSKIEIVFIYRSSDGRESEFNYFAEEIDGMDQKDLTTKNFYHVMGGLKITVDGYKTIFRECTFYVLLRPVTFLLETLYWLKGLTTGFFDKDDDYPSGVVIPTMLDEKLILERDPSGLLSLKFIPPNPDEAAKRGRYYFNSEFIE